VITEAPIDGNRISILVGLNNHVKQINSPSIASHQRSAGMVLSRVQSNQAPAWNFSVKPHFAQIGRSSSVGATCL